MDAPAEMADRHGEALKELAGLGMALARNLQARALAAEDAAAGDLALAFHRIARCVRQTLALELRLERERRQAAREVAKDASRETLARLRKRRAQVRSALAPLIWTEAEGDEDEADALFDDLDARLMEAYDDDAFLADPLDVVIARIRCDMGLRPEAADPADPPAAEAPPSVVIWRSSA
jgi:hypothetical protein